jgi:hypothetical protein
MADASYNNVSLLLPMRGANNGTALADFSPSPKTVAFEGNAKTVTAESKYYGSSLALDGTADWVEVAGSDAFVFGTGAFTVEAWIKTSSAITNKDIVDFYVTGATGWQLFVSSTGKAQLYITASVQPQSTTSVNDGAWHHVAATRESGTLRVFADGIKEAEMSDSTNLSTTQTKLAIGAQVHIRNAAYDFAGWINDVRITKGVARYTANFTPPTRLCGFISGTIEDADGEPAERTIRVYSPSGALAASGLSDGSTGEYEIFTGPTGVAHTVVASGEPDRNDLSLSGVEPV